MKPTLSALFALVVLAGFGAPAAAQDEEDGERNMDAIHCVSIRGIDAIDIVDARNLVFRMRNGDVYRNRLPRQCPGLRRNGTLMYRSSVGQLCSIDIITVLENRSFGFFPGASCGLGMFEPITKDIADELLRSARD
ncbi:MAG TPA: hypothetical protein VF200_15045 [Woeseiaceae bacterium]